MKNTNWFRRSATPAAVACLSLACATTPSPLVEDVRGEFDQADRDPAVGEFASLELYEAEKAVTRLEEAAEQDREAELDHLAYLARRRIEIARVASTAGEAQEKLEELGLRRDETRLRARAQEAESATALAEQRRREAEAARDTARSALERARELEAKLNDVNAKQTERGLVLTMNDVLFGFDQTELQPGAARSLVEVAEFLNEFPDRTIAVEGHTDSVGNDEYNRRLSQQRAQSVAAVLAEHGVAQARIAVEGYGERVPVAPNESASGRQKNRRVEIILAETGDAA